MESRWSSMSQSVLCFYYVNDAHQIQIYISNTAIPPSAYVISLCENHQTAGQNRQIFKMSDDCFQSLGLFVR